MPSLIKILWIKDPIVQKEIPPYRNAVSAVPLGIVTFDLVVYAFSIQIHINMYVNMNIALTWPICVRR